MSTERAPRVLLSGVVLGQPMGGVRRHNAELLPRCAHLLAEAGGALAVLEGRAPAAFPLPPPIERIPSRVPSGPPIARALHEGAALRRALDEARATGRPFDLVHTAHHPVPRRLGAPFTLTVHDLRTVELAGTPSVRRFLARQVLGRAVAEASLVVTVSEDVRIRLEKGFRPRRTAVVPNAADHLELLPRRVDDGGYLLHVGHLEPRKNLTLLLRALSLAPELPRLVLAGAAKGEEGERLEALAHELAIGERVRFLGAVPDEELPGLYAGAACVVLPSRLEGFGIPVLEAQRAGAPLAVAAAGALPEVAGDDVPSFPPGDPAACADAIRRAVASSDDVLRAAAARAARFTWDTSARLLFGAWSAAAADFPRTPGRPG